MDSILLILKPTRGDLLSNLIFVMVAAGFLVGLAASIISFRKGPPASDLQAAGGGLEDVDFQLTSRSDRIAETMPGLLIVIGLLGTFIGIALAIRHAHDAVLGSQGRELSETLASLGPMLGEIGVKFQSSAWGLLGSLALRPVVFFLATERRHHAAHQKFKEIEDKRSAEERGYRQKLLEMTTLSHSHLGAIAESSKVTASVLEHWEEVLKRLDRTADSMQQSAKGTLDAAKELTGGLRKMTGDFERTIKGANDSTATAMGRNEVALNAVRDSVRESKDQLSVAFKKSMEDLRDANRATNELTRLAVVASKDAVASSSRAVGEAVESLKEELTTTLKAGQTSLATSIGEASARSDQAVKASGEALGGALAKMQSSIATLQSVMTTAQETSAGSFASGIQAISQQSKELATSIENQARDSQQKVAQQHEATMGKLDVRLANLVKPLEDMKAAAVQVNVVVEEMNLQSIRAQTTLKDVGESTKSMREAVEKLNDSLNKLVGDFKQTTKVLIKGLETAAAEKSTRTGMSAP